MITNSCYFITNSVEEKLRMKEREKREKEINSENLIDVKVNGGNTFMKYFDMKYFDFFVTKSGNLAYLSEIFFTYSTR